MRVELAIANGEKEIPVTYVEMSEEDEQKVLLLFDPIGSLAKQNTERIKDIVSAVNLKAASTKDFVNSIAKKHKIDTNRYNDTEKNDLNEDQSDEDYQEKDNVVKISHGDIFEIINNDNGSVHRLACGDNNDNELWERLFDGVKPSLCVTSPPYNQKINTFSASGMQKENTSFVDRMSDSYSDDLPEEEYEEKQIKFINKICDYLDKNGSLFYNHKIRYRGKEIIHPMIWLSKINHAVRQEIIWDRGGSITLNARMFIPCDERIYWIRKDNDFVFNDETEIKSWSSVWRFAAKNDVAVSAAFPFELPYRCILSCSKDGDVIFDPYSGSGTVIVAANRTGRIGYGIEYSIDHLSKSIERFKSEGLEVRKV
jgi:DNA modification methylase